MAMRKTMLVPLVVTGLALAGCTTAVSDDPAPGGASTSRLGFQPVVQVDKDGREVAVDTSAVPADPAGDGTASCPSTTTIAMVGPLTGSDAGAGTNIRNGARLAVTQHNAANPGCQVRLEPRDSQGDPDLALEVVPPLIADPNVVALLGPAYSGESKATGPMLHDAGLLALTPAATNPDLTTHGWDNYFRGLASDAVQGPAVAAYMRDTLGYTKVCVVAGDSDYGTDLAAQVTAVLGAVADPTCAAGVVEGDQDFSAAVATVTAAQPDAVFYGGYVAEAALLVKQLRAAGFTGAFVSGDGAADVDFFRIGGDAANGAYVACPCGPAPDAFAAAYTRQFGQAPGAFAVEGYDLTTIILKGIDSGATDRASLVDFVRHYDGQGLARHYSWTSTGELTEALVWIFQVGS